MNARDSVSWQKILAQGFASAKELLEYLGLPLELGCAAAEKLFQTRIPRSFAERMQKGNPRDPLLLQVLAVEEELISLQEFNADPLGEAAANPVPGLLHKYPGRVLLILTGGCAVHCRYCFRRHFPYNDNNPGRPGWQAALNYIRRDPTIHELILSGGDPLLANNKLLADLLQQCKTIGHLRTLRIHTRIPVVLPERIDPGLLKLLAQISLQKVIVLHSNHPQELDKKVAHACLALANIDCQLLNQSVLLQGINDNAQTLADLSERLFSFKVLPYYLHLLDKVAGAGHFDVEETRALMIYRQLQEKLAGYLVPRLVREEVGKKHKSLII